MWATVAMPRFVCVVDISARDDGDVPAALGLIKIHLDEEPGSIPYKDTVEVGARADPRGRADWFTTRRTAEPPRRAIRRG